MELKVKGHSGCQIDIVNDGNDLFIYKTTFDPKYINRLRLQGQKQIVASKQKYQHIRIPEIYDMDDAEDHLTIKMEYIYSQNFIDYFEDAGFEQIRYFIKALEIFVDSEIEKLTLADVDTDVVLNKFYDVYDKVDKNEYINDDEFMEIMLKSKDVFESMPKTIRIPLGTCHGDLTYSNVLFNGNNYYLIDFLDSFIESPLLDLVKIRQDSCFGWSQLMYTKGYDAIRLKMINAKIDSAIDKYYSDKYSWYTDFYKPFQIMNFLRILQYAKDEKVINYLKNVLNSLL